jgi:eukaryotic-like serine/threonine-protein kinase
VITRELATGVRAHAQMSAVTVEKATLIHGVDVADVSDPRLRLLCRGLMTRVPQDRWGEPEVARWCGGESPDVAEPSHETPEKIVAFKFGGVEHRSRESLARGLQNDWAAAARRFFVAMGTPNSPSEAWRKLRAWLQQFGDDETVDQDAFEELLDHKLTSPSSTPDRKLLALISWLDPNLAMAYRGVEVTRENLLDAALSAANSQAPDHRASVEFVWGLFEPGFLADVGRTPGYGWLTDVSAALNGLRDEERRYRNHWSPHIPNGALPPADDPRVVGELLFCALQPGPALKRMSQALHNQRSQLPLIIPWFSRMADQPSGYMDYFFAVQVFPAALHEANAIQQRNEAAAAALRAREQQWSQMEAERLAGSGAAQALALRFLLPAVAAIALLLVVSTVVLMSISESSASAVDSPGSSTSMAGLIALNIVVGGAAAVYIGVSECLLAQKLGRDYRGLTRFSRSGRGLRSFGSRMTAGRGCLLLFLVLILGLPLGYLLVVVSLIPCALAAVFQLRSVSRRRREWDGWHEHARQQVLGGGR